MKNEYIKLELEIVLLDEEDILTSSLCPEDETCSEDGYWGEEDPID